MQIAIGISIRLTSQTIVILLLKEIEIIMFLPMRGKITIPPPI